MNLVYMCVPKQGSTSDPPYMKILNAPITYLH